MKQICLKITLRKIRLYFNVLKSTFFSSNHLEAKDFTSESDGSVTCSDFSVKRASIDTPKSYNPKPVVPKIGGTKTILSREINPLAHTPGALGISALGVWRTSTPKAVTPSRETQKMRHQETSSPKLSATSEPDSAKFDSMEVNAS